MSRVSLVRVLSLIGILSLPMIYVHFGFGQEPQNLPKAFVDGVGPGWRALTEGDFTNVNCYPDTWAWKGDLLTCTGKPIGVMRTRQTFTNFELVVEWRHLKSAGNSGVFAWVPDEALKDLKSDALPKFGIEIQMLDHGYREQYENNPAGKAIGSQRMATSLPSAIQN